MQKNTIRISVEFDIDTDSLPEEEAEFLKALRRKLSQGLIIFDPTVRSLEGNGNDGESKKASVGSIRKGTLCVCDSDERIKKKRSEGIPCIAYDPEGSSFFNWVLESLEGLDDDFIKKAYCRQSGIPLLILKTKRTYIREYCNKDLDALFELYEGPETTKYIEPLYEREKERKYEENYIKLIYDLYDYGMWLVCDRETDRVIGRAGIEKKKDTEDDEVELGYVIAYDRRREGYATEVCEAILKWTARLPEISRVKAVIDEKNLPSIALIKKLGFTKIRGEHWEYLIPRAN